MKECAKIDRIKILKDVSILISTSFCLVRSFSFPLQRGSFRFQPSLVWSEKINNNKQKQKPLAHLVLSTYVIHSKPKNSMTFLFSYFYFLWSDSSIAFVGTSGFFFFSVLLIKGGTICFSYSWAWAAWMGHDWFWRQFFSPTTFWK